MDRRSFQAVPFWAAVTMKSAKLISILKLMKFTKIIVTASTLALSTLAYGWAFGPWFGVGLIAMLLIHEMGHVIALRWKGYPINLPVFIPFLGAAIFVKDFGDRETEAYIGYGGPLLGSLAAFLCMAAWLLTGSPPLLLTAYLGIYLNLFNMLPIRPLDGGRITQLAGSKLKYGAIALLVGYTLYVGEPALLLLWVFLLQEIKFPLWWRTGIAAALGGLMLLGFVVGFSQQPEWINIIDLISASAFTGIYATIDRARANHVRAMRDLLAMAPQYPDDADYRKMVKRATADIQRSRLGDDDLRPYPVRRIRLKWLSIYLASTAVLAAAMAYLIDKLPTQ